MSEDSGIKVMKWKDGKPGAPGMILLIIKPLKGCGGIVLVTSLPPLRSQGILIIWEVVRPDLINFLLLGLLC